MFLYIIRCIIISCNIANLNIFIVILIEIENNIQEYRIYIPIYIYRKTICIDRELLQKKKVHIRYIA